VDFRTAHALIVLRAKKLGYEGYWTLDVTAGPKGGATIRVYVADRPNAYFNEILSFDDAADAFERAFNAPSEEERAEQVGEV
jgi:hypothetical protein